MPEIITDDPYRHLGEDRKGLVSEWARVIAALHPQEPDHANDNGAADRLAA